MAPTSHRLKICSVLVLALVSAAPATQPASMPTSRPTSEERQLYERVQAGYRASRAAIASVACDYQQTSNGRRTLVRYARDGEKLYMASIAISRRGDWTFPNEVSWDGTVGYQRNSADATLVQWASRPSGGASTPEASVNISVGNALDVAPTDGAEAFALAEASSTTDDQGVETVELQFTGLERGYSLVTVHRSDVGYWPVRTELRRESGELSSSMEAEYTRREMKDRAVFYPTLIRTAGTGRDGRMRNRIQIAVDLATFDLNNKVDAGRFRIEPWPNEEVTEFAGKMVRKPVDPQWDALGKVGFPWDIVLRTREEKKRQEQERQGKPAASTNGGSQHAGPHAA